MYDIYNAETIEKLDITLEKCTNKTTWNERPSVENLLIGLLNIYQKKKWYIML